MNTFSSITDKAYSINWSSNSTQKTHTDRNTAKDNNKDSIIEQLEELGLEIKKSFHDSPQLTNFTDYLDSLFFQANFEDSSSIMELAIALDQLEDLLWAVELMKANTNG